MCFFCFSFFLSFYLFLWKFFAIKNTDKDCVCRVDFFSQVILQYSDRCSRLCCTWMFVVCWGPCVSRHWQSYLHFYFYGALEFFSNFILWKFLCFENLSSLKLKKHMLDPVPSLHCTNSESQINQPSEPFKNVQWAFILILLLLTVGRSAKIHFMYIL